MKQSVRWRGIGVWVVALATWVVACAPSKSDVDGSKVEPSSTLSESSAGSGLPFDLGGVARRARESFRAQGPGFKGEGAAYRVAVDAGRVSLSALRAAPVGTALELETVSPRAPKVEIGSRGELRLDRGEATEVLENTDSGLEQSWRVDARPEHGGDFVVRVAVRGQRLRAQTDAGLHFAGAENDLGFRYGHAKWVDAAGRETPVRAQWTDGAIELRVPVAVVDTALYPAVLDPVISPEIDINEPFYASSPAEDTSPALASDGNGTSLVVWQSRFSVVATRIATDGALLDPGGFVVAPTGSLASVAYGGSSWLVVWRDSRGLCGARIDSSGRALDPDGIVLAPDALAYHTAVSFNGENWLAVWQDGTGSLGAVRVAPSGAVLDSTAIPIAPSPGTGPWPDVASNGSEWLVVWNFFTGSDDIPYAARIDATGAVLDPGGVALAAPSGVSYPTRVSSDGTNWFVVWREPAGVVGTRIAQDGAILDTNPVQVAASAAPGSIGYDGTDWLVAWDSAIGMGVTRVATSGVVLDPNGLPLAASQGGMPLIAFDGSHWLATWDSYSARDIFAARLDVNGTILGNPFLVSMSPSRQRAPAVASNGTEWLVVWEDFRGKTDANGVPTEDIYGTRVDGSGTVLDPVGIAIAASPGIQSAPCVAANGTTWLVAWADRVDLFSNSAIHGARVDGAGTVLDSAALELSISGNSTEPDVSSDGTNWLVAWAGGGATRVDPAGTVLDPDGITLPVRGAPSIGWNGSNWLIASETSDGTGAVRVAPSGAALDSTPIGVSATGYLRQIPSVSADGTNWLVAWPVNGAIRGARVASSGVVLDASGIPISTGSSTTTGAEAHSVSLAHDGTNWLALWADFRNGVSDDVYGIHMSASGVAVENQDFLVSGTAQPESAVRVAVQHDGTALAVYQSGSDGRIKGRLIPSSCVPKATDDSTCDGVDDDCDGDRDDDYIPRDTTCGIAPCESTGTTRCENGIVVDGCIPAATCPDAGQGGMGGESGVAGNGGASAGGTDGGVAGNASASGGSAAGGFGASSGLGSGGASGAGTAGVAGRSDSVNSVSGGGCGCVLAGSANGEKDAVFVLCCVAFLSRRRRKCPRLGSPEEDLGSHLRTLPGSPREGALR